MTFYSAALWCYAVMASVVFGSGVYETLVVHPAWSRQPPESIVGFVGSPVGRMHLAAFWAPVIPLYALSALGALAVPLWAGSRETPLILSVACCVSALAWTLIYFRPTIHRLLDGGGSIPAGRLESVARRWVRLNVIRVALVGVSWWGALTTLATHV